ncbi:hypothetical protein GIB67_031106 [Kingdonia uniflora]|uniref:Uncharacterized protein n=1 Tax=Kingdonia uniflora TaxID=39325 RepID=A0A7J7L1S4_9MAGN|nr:hypothetical protein GIB67_031106 [Kingdonia uniflora]
MASLSTIMSQKTVSPCVQTVTSNEKKLNSQVLKEVKQSGVKLNQQNTQRNEQELNASLTVIRKIMKMDAAEPLIFQLILLPLGYLIILM